MLAISTLKYVNTLAAWQMEAFIKEKEHPTCQESRQVEELDSVNHPDSKVKSNDEF